MERLEGVSETLGGIGSCQEIIIGYRHLKLLDLAVKAHDISTIQGVQDTVSDAISTESCLDTGNSGLVTLVGFEKVGMLRSTRLLLGATGISAGTGGWGIILDPPSPAAEVDAAERAPVAILGGLSS